MTDYYISQSHAADKLPFLEPSPSKVDGGNLIGRDPRKVPVADLLTLGQPASPIKAIRAWCIDCSGGNQTEARKCPAVKCPLWAFRMGKNVYRGVGSADASEGGESEAQTHQAMGFDENTDPDSGESQ